MKNLSKILGLAIVAIVAVVLVIGCKDSNKSNDSVEDNAKSNTDLSIDSNQDSHESNAQDLEQSNKIAQLSLDEVYLDNNPKPLTIINDKIDFWGKAFFAVWSEGFKHNGKYINCGEYLNNGKDGWYVGIRIFDKARGVVFSDGAIVDEHASLSEQKVLNADFENGIWTLDLSDDMKGHKGDSQIKFRFLRDDEGNLYVQHFKDDKRICPHSVQDFTYMPSDELPDMYVGEWVKLENPLTDEKSGQSHECAPLSVYEKTPLPKDDYNTIKQNCFTAYKRANYERDYNDIRFDNYTIDKQKGIISWWYHSADFPTESPIVLEKTAQGFDFIQSGTTTLDILSVDSTQMRFVDDENIVAYFGEDSLPYVHKSDLAKLGIPIYVRSQDEKYNDIYTKEGK